MRNEPEQAAGAAPEAWRFNPRPVIRTLPLGDGQVCVVVDDAMLQPERVVEWARTQLFEVPAGYPYPGLVLNLPPVVIGRVADHFAQHVRGLLGARRTVSLATRLSLITTPPAQLAPIQWQCHRDQLAVNPEQILFAASVLYLFRDPALGGTSFYRPRLAPAQIDSMVADGMVLDAAAFGARYGLGPGYMNGSNDYFEHVARVPAAWNRMIFYDGGLFHSADVDPVRGLSADPARGRLTLNSFITCRRRAT